MELEELAAQAKAREPGAVLELWETVRRFVEMKARERARAGSRVPLEDLAQAGFLAVLDAAEQYDPDRENASFLSLLSLKLRAIADLARENAAARSIVGELLDAVAGKLPGEAETFRAYYLEGEAKPSARQVAQRLYMDRATVFSHTRRIFTAMLPVAFGPEFEEKPKPPRERTKPSPRKRTPQHRRAFFALLDDVSRIAYAYREQETAQEAPGGRRKRRQRPGRGNLPHGRGELQPEGRKRARSGYREEGAGPPAPFSCLEPDRLRG